MKSKFNYKYAVLSVVLCCAVHFVEYSSFGFSVAIGVMLLNVIIAILNKKSGFLLFILTSILFDDLPYDLMGDAVFYSLHNLTFFGQTLEKILIIFWGCIVFWDCLNNKMEFPKDGIFRVFNFLLLVSASQGIITGNIVHTGPFLNDLRFFFNFLVGYLGILLYVNRADEVLRLIDLVCLVFLGKIVVFVGFSYLLSKNTIIYTLSSDTGFYLIPTLILLYWNSAKKKRWLSIASIFLCFLVLGITASRGKFIISLLQFSVFLLMLRRLRWLPLLAVGFIVPLLLIPLFSNEMYEYILWKLNSFTPSVGEGESALVRYIELKNIIYQDLMSPIKFFVGTGLGGSWDSHAFRYPFELYGTTSYPIEWIETDTFFKPHGVIQFSLLKFGIGGTFLFYSIFLILLKKWRGLYRRCALCQFKNIDKRGLTVCVIIISGLCVIYLVAYSAKLQLLGGLFAGSILVLQRKFIST